MPADNFLPRTLRDFSFDPLSANYIVPPSWGGKLCMLFVLKDGTPGTKSRAYVTGPREVLRLPDSQVTPLFRCSMSICCAPAAA